MKSRTRIARPSGSGLALLGLLVFACLTIQARQVSLQKPTTATGAVSLTATSANVAEVGKPVRISILRWSTEEERVPLVAAMSAPAPVPAATAAAAPVAAVVEATPAEGASVNADAAAPAGRGRGGRGGRGAAARGAAVAPGDAAPGGAAPAGRGAGARGGRGGARGGRGNAPVDPLAILANSPTLGYIWTSEVVGYSIKYAEHTALPNGGERIVLATDRRLGADATAWKPAAPATLTDYPYTLIEIRLDSKGLGEGKTSLTTKLIIDNEAKTVGLENYATTPAILQNVKR